MQEYNYIFSAWEKKSSEIDGRWRLPVSLRFFVIRKCLMAVNDGGYHRVRR